MSKKQKAKRNKIYIPKLTIKRRGLKPPKNVEVTTKEMLKKNVLKDYILWLDDKIEAETQSDKDLYVGWFSLAYLKEDEKYENGQKFLKWYKKQKSQNLKVYAFYRKDFVEYEVKKALEVELPHGYYSILVEIAKRTDKKKKEPAYPNFTNFDKNENQMVVYNSNNIAFNLEIEVVETIKEVVKKEQIIQKVDADKTEKFKNKITKFIKSKQFENAYLNSLENLKQEILNITK